MGKLVVTATEKPGRRWQQLFFYAGEVSLAFCFFYFFYLAICTPASWQS
jgi:hypothetical protein